MSAAALATSPGGRLFEPADLGREGATAPLPVHRSDGGRPTLEQLLGRAWEGLHAAGAAECPVCAGRMRAAGCADCGAQLR